MAPGTSSSRSSFPSVPIESAHFYVLIDVHLSERTNITQGFDEEEAED